MKLALPTNTMVNKQINTPRFLQRCLGSLGTWTEVNPTLVAASRYDS